MSFMEVAQRALLPEKGAEFEVAYFDGERELEPHERLNEPHTHVAAVSPGLQVTVHGAGSRVVQRRQRKPFVSDAIIRTMLVAEMDGVHVHILGPHIVISRDRLTVGQVAEGIE